MLQGGVAATLAGVTLYCATINVHNQNFIAMAFFQVGDHQPYTATTKDFGSKREFQRGWCTDCQNLREQQDVYHPQDCTGDVHHGFCGGGAWIVGFEKNNVFGLGEKVQGATQLGATGLRAAERDICL